ncbi:hypothetical protein ACFQ51_45010 [Streptomyces kaempferi]
MANGDHDRMVPSSNSADLARRLLNAQLSLYRDAGAALRLTATAATRATPADQPQLLLLDARLNHGGDRQANAALHRRAFGSGPHSSCAALNRVETGVPRRWGWRGAACHASTAVVVWEDFCRGRSGRAHRPARRGASG